jgi:hypothetical protein
MILPRVMSHERQSLCLLAPSWGRSLEELWEANRV